MRARTASSRSSPARRAFCQPPAPPARAPLAARALPRPARLTLDAPCRPTLASPEIGHALPPCCAVLRGELPAAPTRHYAVHSRGPPLPAAAPRQNPIREMAPVAPTEPHTLCPSRDGPITASARRHKSHRARLQASLGDPPPPTLLPTTHPTVLSPAHAYRVSRRPDTLRVESRQR